MKYLWIPLSLILILVQLPFGDFNPKAPEEKKTPVKGWWMVSSFAVAPTRYSRAGKGIIKAESLGSRSSLYREVGEKEKGLPALSWRWKISNVVRSAIETRKDRFDTAARLMAVFGGDEGVKVREGTEPSGFRIEYIWASHLPIGHIFDHPGEKNCKIFVLESGEKKAGEWIFEKRNLHTDYKKAFATEPGGLLAIGIQTDTDHSNEMVTAYYSDPILKKK
jgi:hypothetical protein